MDWIAPVNSPDDHLPEVKQFTRGCWLPSASYITSHAGSLGKQAVVSEMRGDLTLELADWVDKADKHLDAYLL